MWSKLAKISVNTLLIAIILSLVFVNFVGIANAESLRIDNDRATISWNTNIPADSRVDFGLSNSYGAYVVSQGSTNLNHELSLNNLHSDAVYHFKITSQSTDGQILSTFDRTFTTSDFEEGSGDLEIKNLRVVYTTGTSITFQWYTEVPSTSVVHYGRTTAYGKRVENRKKVNNHDITVGGLNVSTRYNFKVESVDADGDMFSYYNQSHKTTITDSAERTALKISDFGPITANDSGIRDTSIILSWSTNRLAGGYIYYGTDSNRLKNKVSLEQLQVFRSMDHEFLLSDLEPDTTYYFMIKAVDVFGAKKDSNVYSVRTKAASEVEQSNGSSASKYSEPEMLYQARSSVGMVTYAVYNGQKYGIPSIDTFNRYKFSWNDVRRVSEQTIKSIPNIHLVKTNDSHKVYQIFNNKKIHIPGPAAFNSYVKNSWTDIITFDKTDVDRYPTASLVKTADSPTVYLIKNGYKKEIVSGNVFESRGYKWNDIITINRTHLSAYVTGLPVK